MYIKLYEHISYIFEVVNIKFNSITYLVFIWDFKFNLELISKHLIQNILIFVFLLDLVKNMHTVLDAFK